MKKATISIIVETIDKINTISIIADKIEKLVYNFDHNRNDIADHTSTNKKNKEKKRSIDKSLFESYHG